MQEDNNNDYQKYCRYCDEAISTKANVCHYCGLAQNKLLRYSGDLGVLASVVGVVLSAIMAMLSIGGSISASQSLQGVKNATVATAEFHIENVLNRGYARIPSTEELIEQQIRVSNMLKRAGINADVINDAVMPLTKTIELRRQEGTVWHSLKNETFAPEQGK